MADVTARAATVRRNLVSLLLWILIGGSALVLVLRVLTGEKTETQRVQVEAAQHKSTMDGRTISPQEIATLMDGQITGQPRVTPMDPSGPPPHPGSGARPLKMPDGTPPPRSDQSDATDGNAQGRSVGPEHATSAQTLLAQARSSEIAAYEDGEHSAPIPVPGQVPAGFDTLRQIANYLPSSSGLPTGTPGLDSLSIAKALQGGVKPSIESTTQANQAWLNQQGQQSQDDDRPLMPKVRAAEYMLHEGATIPVAVIRAANSDLPGRVKAMVIQDIYDDVHGRYLVIPKGSKVDLVYNGEVTMGQSRILMAATRMTFKTGATIRLASSEIADATGASGAPAEVDNHFWQIFGSSLLIGAVASAANSSQSSNVTVNVGGSNLSSTAGQILADTSKRMLDRYQNVKPTLSLPAGERLLLVTSRDMVLPPAITGGRIVY